VISEKMLLRMFFALIAGMFFAISGCKSVAERGTENKTAIEKQAIPSVPQTKILVKTHEISLPVKSLKTKTALPKEPTIISLDNTVANRLSAPEKDSSRFLAPDAFVSKWSILGPFRFKKNKFKNIGEVLHFQFIADEQSLQGKRAAPAAAHWQESSFSEEKSVGMIDLNNLYSKNIDYAVAYAVCFLVSPQEFSDLTLLSGGSDFLKIWINKKLVHAYNQGPRKGDLDQDVIKEIKLKKGYNLVVLKCVKMTGEWSFYFRLATKDKLPLRIKQQ